MTPPRIALIATGGTIAGAAASAAHTTDYQVGGVGAEQLVAAVPQLGEVAELEVMQLFNIDSKDLQPTQWLQLAQVTRALLARPDIKGVVITHGTDTLEETATALALLFPARASATGKPVVLTCAMRPSTALSADGPMNLFDAVRCAASPDAAMRGVMLCFGERILPALGLRKLDSHKLAAFDSSTADLGATRPDIRFHAAPKASNSVLDLPTDDTSLPRVDVLYCAAGTPSDLLNAALDRGAQGIVLALPGNGSVPDNWFDALTAAVMRNTIIIRASRCGQGMVFPSAVDAQIGSLAAGILSPAAARVAAMLTLATRHVQPDFDAVGFLRQLGQSTRT